MVLIPLKRVLKRVQDFFLNSILYFLRNRHIVFT